MNHAVDWARTFGGLLIVLAMIVAAGWLLRKLQQRAGMGPAGRRSQVLSVVAQQMLGAREKVVVVEVQGTWLVLGVTQQHIQTLHTLPRPADAGAPVADDPPTHDTHGGKPPAFADALALQIKRRLTGKPQ
ncbi:flagellar biosynthetic protein FliO [Ralstonia pseudosolanacearum]|uniref:Flagellar protein n=3 Tax=Ralstonia solanacearum species complex TaxID=3116862 RepID=A0A0S4U450_RALSL|nr:flagellar biosynthetic protein FliO [Ralstonia pseudosolanacearum]AUS44552.1 flagellar biosynthetic protein FliO [Ralstonia solanacearum]API76951.1 flagellar biosynthesis protein FliO [Ralstonia pseudosolanacearum]AST88648.1 flagellar biosynthetic protein FliO [Ralstonia pseudosolanacearum]AYA48634.1 flagellar biosynthetic protein FliO [Ralstonia pseudosolanacearum]KAF3459269.1 flagellar biosynthesis protein FliO [Ralstonia solanacearum]